MADAPPIARWRQIGCAIKTLRAEAKVRLTGFSEREWRGQILYGVQPQLGCGTGMATTAGRLPLTADRRDLITKGAKQICRMARR
jgi:hypothetical protein